MYRNRTQSENPAGIPEEDYTYLPPEPQVDILLIRTFLYPPPETGVGIHIDDYVYLPLEPGVDTTEKDYTYHLPEP